MCIRDRMVLYVDDAFRRRLAEGRLRTPEDVVEAHAEGTVRRLRPKIMTIATMGAGLLPLQVLPVLYTLWRVGQLRRAERMGLSPEAFYSRTGAAMEGTPLVSTRKSM